MNTSPIFKQEDRAQLRAELLERSRQDQRIVGAAITGSAAIGNEDRWSDVDLAFGVAAGAEPAAVLADWSAWMYEHHAAVHHLDMVSGAWTYRVFFLPNTLQVDLAFVVEAEFRGLGPTFKLIHGTAREVESVPTASASSLIGYGWLYALHTRSCIGRGKLWQAEYMISGVRDYAFALACLRHGLSTYHGRGMDQLPAEVKKDFESALVRSLERSELRRAFAEAVRQLLFEAQQADAELHSRLAEPLQLLLA